MNCATSSVGVKVLSKVGKELEGVRVEARVGQVQVEALVEARMGAGVEVTVKRSQAGVSSCKRNHKPEAFSV